MSKHLRVSSKAMLAILACLALLCSLFVVSFVASAGSEDDTYTPKRYVTMEVGDSVNPTIQLKLSKSLFDATETYTIKGMAKVENFGILRGDAGGNFFLDLSSGGLTHNFNLGLKANTDWTAFSKEFKNDSTADLTKDLTFIFGGWMCSGKVSYADLQIVDSTGKVVYDMNEDTDLADAAFSGKWSAYDYNSETYPSVVATKFSVYNAPYSPNRYLKLSTKINKQPCYEFNTSSFGAEGAPYTVSMKIKVENFGKIENNNSAKVEFRNDFDDLDAGGTPIQGNTNGFVLRNYTIDTMKNPLRIGFLYTSGDLYIADLIVKDKNGNVKYSLNEDSTLDDMTTFSPTATWGRYLYTGEPVELTVYNEASDTSTDTSDTSTDTSDTSTDTSDTSTDTSDTSTDTSVDSKPPFDPGTDPEYEFNRSITVSGKGNINPVVRLGLMSDDYGAESGPYTLVGKIKLAGFEALEGGTAQALVHISYDNGGEITLDEALSLTANTDGWIDLKKADGSYITFDKIDDIANIIFGLLYAKGDLSIADLRIVDKENNIVYSMANDPTLYGKTSMKKIAGSSMWSSADYTMTDKTIPASDFVIQTKATPYTPNKIVTMKVDPENPAVNPLLILMNADDKSLMDVAPLTITGKIRVDNMGQIENSAGNTAAFNLGGNGYTNTDGWVSITSATGDPMIVQSTDLVGNHFSLNGWYASGDVSLADVKITDKDGNVIFDMETADLGADGLYNSGVAFGRMWTAAFGSGTAKYMLQTNPNPVTHKPADYAVPLFEETGKPADGGNSSVVSTPDGPKTGAQTPILFCTVLGAAALVGMALVVSKKSKKRV